MLATWLISLAREWAYFAVQCDQGKVCTLAIIWRGLNDLNDPTASRRLQDSISYPHLIAMMIASAQL